MFSSQSILGKSHLALLSLLLLPGAPSLLFAQQIKVEVRDEVPYHVHPPGETFSVRVEVKTHGRSRLFCHWRDFQGLALSAPVELHDGVETVVESPGTTVGYYGLVIGAENPREFLPHQERGEPQEYGFAILPERTIAQRVHNQDARFGMVHSDTRDPYMRGWVKTSTWKNRDPQQMATYVDDLRGRGLEELPLLVDAEWRTDDAKPITDAELEALQERLASYFKKNPDLRYWELGIEENLNPFYKEAFYWDNLAAKAQAARRASDSAGTDMKIVYQVVSSGGSDSMMNFLNSEAAKHFDLLAMHPYTWKRFPNPDRWLAFGLDQVEAAMAERGLDLPIWFTEVGSPQHSSACGGCLRAGESAYNVSGKSREDQVAFMIKLHAIAFQKGVGKVFWYNYIDRSNDRIDDPEEYFGLRNHDGFPKPVYVAYVAMLDHLLGKEPSGIREIGNNLRAHDFRGEQENCSLIWSYPVSESSLTLDQLQQAVGDSKITKITNAVGMPIELAEGERLFVAKHPLFVTTDSGN